MSSQYDGSLIDFDLDFLQELPKSPEKSKDAIIRDICRIKSEILASDQAISKFYEVTEELKICTQELNSTKEIHQKLFVDYNLLAEKAEKEKQILNNINKNLKEEVTELRNSKGAAESHAKQLQLLLNEQQPLNPAPHSEEKGIFIQNEDLAVIKNIISPIKVNKRTKTILKKYGLYTNGADSDTSKGEFVLSKKKTSVASQVMSFPMLCTDNKDKEIKELEEKVTILQEKVTDLQNSLTATKSSKKRELEELQEKVTELQDALATIESSKVREVKELKEKITVQEDALKAAETRVNQLQISLNEKETNEFCNIKTNLKQYKRIQSKSNIESRKKETIETEREKKKVIQPLNIVTDSIENDLFCGDIVSTVETGRHRHLFSPPTSPTDKKVHTISTKNTDRKIDPDHATSDDNEHDSEFSYDLTSRDTGCGSSLAFSDGEKFFNSPEYAMVSSPINLDTADNTKVKKIDAATSPIVPHKYAHIATSPIRAVEGVNAATSPIPFSESPISFNEISTSPERICEISILSNTVNNIIPHPERAKEIPSSPIASEKLSAVITPRFEVDETIKMDLPDEKSRLVNTTVKRVSVRTVTSPIVTDSNVLNHEKPNVQEELNHSENVNDNSIDCEVEMILNAMRFDHALISPIPPSPLKRQSTAVSAFNTRSSEYDSRLECKEIKEELIKFKQKIFKRIKKMERQQLAKKLPSEPNSTDCISNSNTNNMSPSFKDENDLNSDFVSVHAARAEVKNIVPNKNNPGRFIKQLQFEKALSPGPEFMEREINTTKEFVERGTQIGQERNDAPRQVKRRKVTKLDRMRQKIMPKTKIKIASTSPIKRSRISSIKVNRNTSDATAVSNNEAAYEKARKFMLDLKTQQNLKTTRSIGKAPKPRLRQKLSDIKKTLIQIETEGNPCKTQELNANEESLDFPNEAINLLPHFPTENTRTDLNTNNAISKDCVLFEQRNEKETDKQSSQCYMKTSEIEICETTQSHSNENNTIVLSELQNPDEINKSKQLDTIETSIKESHTNKFNFSKESLVSVEKYDNSNTDKPTRTSPRILTRNRKHIANPNNSPTQTQDSIYHNTECDIHNPNEPGLIEQRDSDVTQEPPRKRLCIEKQTEIECKRILRRSTRHQPKIDEICKNDTDINSNQNTCINSDKSVLPVDKNMIVGYGELDLFNETNTEEADSKITNQQSTPEKTEKYSPIESIFCTMLKNYGKQKIKIFSKKLSDNIVISISKTIETEVTEIIKLPPNKSKHAANKFVEIVMKWDLKHFVSGLLHYLKDTQRKDELFNKISLPPEPPMTKSERVLVYLLAQLKIAWSSIDIVDCVLFNIQYTLCKLNRTPEFGTIESMGHFYALVCRYFGMKSRLKLFMLDAMYCIQFKSIPLIKQCLEVWPHVLPLAHMGIAKSPLVTCMVYLLHFYKCEDRFNRVQDIRNILSRRYFFEITEWNELKIIEMFRSAIKDVRAISLEKKLLRLALILLAKRRGTQWCQNVLIKKVILPLIDDAGCTEKVKVFCVSMLGPLLKPYALDMKVHCEIIINLLTDMLAQNPTPQLEEAITSSLMFLSRHSHNRIIQVLLNWKPKRISPELESQFRNFVHEKPAKVWQSILSKMQLK